MSAKRYIEGRYYQRSNEQSNTVIMSENRLKVEFRNLVRLVYFWWAARLKWCANNIGLTLLIIGLICLALVHFKLV